jgi:hypothetical protein
MRYFVVLDQGAPFALWRFDSSKVKEERWTDGEWVSSEVIVEYLALGEGNFEEVTEELATQTFPDAFVDNVSKSIGNYEVSKAEGEKRYTLGAMYIPDRIDAHGEWTSAEELQRAVWDYVRTDDRRIRLQHNRDIVAGEWVEVMAFPYELTTPILKADGTQENHTYPANTVFLGVIWEPWAWEKVQNGEILGYSIGGKAERLYVDMEAVAKEDGPGVPDVHLDTIMNPKKKKKIPLVDTPEMLMEKESELDVEALTKTIIESIKKELPPLEPVVIEKAPSMDMESMMVRLAEIMAANQPVINVVMPEEKPITRRIERDEFGNIARIVEDTETN